MKILVSVNNYQICFLLKVNFFRLENFTCGIVDQGKIRTYVRNNMEHIEFDNKRYIITENKFSSDHLAARCASIGSEYKPAFINYNEEYEMWVSTDLFLLINFRKKCDILRKETTVIHYWIKWCHVTNDILECKSVILCLKINIWL